jgi:hypothetical protein
MWNWRAVSVCQCHIIMSIGWPPTLTVMSSKVIRFYTAVMFQCLVERKKDVGTWLVLPYKKFQVDQTWEGVFCESSWTRIIQTPMASFHPFHGWL